MRMKALQNMAKMRVKTITLHRNQKLSPIYHRINRKRNNLKIRLYLSPVVT